MTPHFFVGEDRIAGDEALLDDDDTRHLVTVLRARPGSAATVSDGAGTVWSATYAGLADGTARMALQGATFAPAPRPTLTVVHALPKQRKLDEVVQRLTELGVTRIVPVASERSQVHLEPAKATKAVARWRAVAVAAAKQSKRSRIPIVDEVGAWDTAFGSDMPGMVCWEEAKSGLRDVLSAIADPDEMVIAVGPEGGLTPAEVERSGLPAASLGASILRTETAAVVAAAAVTYHFGLMEPA